jgi:hypothetical protein
MEGGGWLAVRIDHWVGMMMNRATAAPRLGKPAYL